MLWTIGTREARVSLREDTPTPHIDLAELAEQAKIHSRRELVSLIERLMGEIYKRCKHKWMHWSTHGLRNILILIQYTDEALYTAFKKSLYPQRGIHLIFTAEFHPATAHHQNLRNPL